MLSLLAILALEIRSSNFDVPVINIGKRQHKRLNSKIIKDIEINNINIKTVKTF